MADPSTGLETDDLRLLEEASAGYNRLREQIGRAIIGQEHVVEMDQHAGGLLSVTG